MARPIRHARAIIAFVVVFAVFLVCIDVFLVANERKKLQAEYENDSRNELILIGTFVSEPLLQQQFAVVEEFVKLWGKRNSAILEIKALSPKGFLLAHYKRPGSAPGGLTITVDHKISFMERHLLDMEIVKDMSSVTRHLHEFWNQLIFKSLIVSIVFGVVIWLILKKLALQPLEKEIVRREHAEQSLQKAHDLLESKVVERTSDLASEKERLAVTLSSIGDGVLTTDVEGKITLINTAAEQLTGWKQEKAMGRPFSEVFNIIDEITRQRSENHVQKVVITGQTTGLAQNTLLIAKDGTEKRIADSGAPIRDRENKIIGVVLAFRDITDQLRLEHELIKVKNLESIGVLAGGIAHDFNNILAAILGNINLALFDTELKDRTKKLLSAAEKASLRAKDLTQQLLTFAKGGEPVKEASSLESVIKDSANFVLHGDKVACHYDIPEDLWLVDIDKGQISQVIQNLVLNASHAMPEGGIIKVKCENLASGNGEAFFFTKNGSFVKISIQDSGIGMPVNVAEKIFDPYFTTKHEGSGLGLAITQSIINKHNGHISAESSPGAGSTFTIYLPASDKTKTQKQKSYVEYKPSSRAKILIMEDDEMVRTVTKNMLVQLGHKVVLAADGEEALRLYQEAMKSDKLFDLVIMDLTIPGGMGGEEAVQEILNIDPEAKVIVSSGYSNSPVMANFKNYGFCSAIVKPYQIQELAKIIDQLLP